MFFQERRRLGFLASRDRRGSRGTADLPSAGHRSDWSRWAVNWRKRRSVRSLERKWEVLQFKVLSTVEHGRTLWEKSSREIICCNFTTSKNLYHGYVFSKVRIPKKSGSLLLLLTLPLRTKTYLRRNLSTFIYICILPDIFHVVAAPCYRKPILFLLSLLIKGPTVL